MLHSVDLMVLAMKVVEYTFDRRIREKVVVDDVQFVFRPGIRLLLWSLFLGGCGRGV